MWKLLIGVVFGCVAVGTTALAYEVSAPKPEEAYAVVPLSGNPERSQVILGTLSGDPILYEMTSDTPFTLTAEIRGVPGGAAVPQLSGIIVRQNEQLGVAEVARLKATDAAWTPARDGITGLTYLVGPFWSEEVPAGTYRIEVSTPTNAGKYLLVLGGESEGVGYFATLRSIRAVYAFYGVSTLHMFSSPYIHYPLGIGLLLGLLAATWYWQRRRLHHA